MTLSAAPAYAERGEKKDSVAGDALNAATQPLNDLNLRSKDIPETLLRIEDDPYSVIGLDECGDLRGEITLLDEVLGPDADAEAKKSGVASKALKTGGNILGGFIPFRGVVRQLSGANAQRAKMEAAVYAGVARRSFLKGVAFAKQCKTSEEMVVEASEDVLGLNAVPDLSPE